MFFNTHWLWENRVWQKKVLREWSIWENRETQKNWNTVRKNMSLNIISQISCIEVDKWYLISMTLTTLFHCKLWVLFRTTIENQAMTMTNEHGNLYKCWSHSIQSIMGTGQIYKLEVFIYFNVNILCMTCYTSHVLALPKITTWALSECKIQSTYMFSTRNHSFEPL